MSEPRTLVSTLPSDIHQDDLLCAIIDELRECRQRRMTDDERKWLRFISEETGDAKIHQLIFSARGLESEELLSIARGRGANTGGPTIGFLAWILGPRPSPLGVKPNAPNNVVFRLRMLLKRAQDAPALDADVDEAMAWLASSELPHGDIDHLEDDVRTWRRFR